MNPIVSPKILAEALFLINRHAKTALDPRELYALKEMAIRKMITKGLAKKIGLHYSKNPKNAQQHTVLLIQVDEFYFHLPPRKEDLESLPHLGNMDAFMNPKVHLSYPRAKKILQDYLNLN